MQLAQARLLLQRSTLRLTPLQWPPCSAGVQVQGLGSVVGCGGGAQKQSHHSPLSVGPRCSAGCSWCAARGRRSTALRGRTGSAQSWRPAACSMKTRFPGPPGPEKPPPGTNVQGQPLHTGGVQITSTSKSDHSVSTWGQQHAVWGLDAQAQALQARGCGRRRGTFGLLGWLPCARALMHRDLGGHAQSKSGTGASMTTHHAPKTKVLMVAA